NAKVGLSDGDERPDGLYPHAMSFLHRRLGRVQNNRFMRQPSARAGRSARIPRALLRRAPLGGRISRFSIRVSASSRRRRLSASSGDSTAARSFSSAAIAFVMARASARAGLSRGESTGSFATGPFPYSVAIDPDGRYVYVGNDDSSGYAFL